MERPNKEDYTKYWVLENDQYVLRGLGRYQEDLEMYCDELELEKGYVQMHADAFLDSLKKQDKEIERLNKALDKACKILEFNEKSSYCDRRKNKEQWKEWLMKDE